MKRLADWYIRVEHLLCQLLMIGVVFFVFFAAVMRWVGVPIAWSVEFAQLLFAWLIFLGANWALREDCHIGVDIFTKRLPKKIALPLQIVMMVLMLFFLILVGGYAVLLSIENSVRLINNMSISYSFITLSVPAGCLLMSCTLIAKIKHTVGQAKEKHDSI
ncbi:MAG: TRAP transporter small permease [Brevibacillus sp.]|nr:TRAP transporter small permease [Brevibacillus sp.]